MMLAQEEDETSSSSDDGDENDLWGEFKGKGDEGDRGRLTKKQGRETVADQDHSRDTVVGTVSEKQNAFGVKKGRTNADLKKAAAAAQEDMVINEFLR